MLLKGELYNAPITLEPQNVLDLGTGTGIWAMDMAEYVEFSTLYRCMPAALIWDVGNSLMPTSLEMTSALSSLVGWLQTSSSSSRILNRNGTTNETILTLFMHDVWQGMFRHLSPIPTRVIT